jgi:hypothetical protein
VSVPGDGAGKPQDAEQRQECSRHPRAKHRPCLWEEETHSLLELLHKLGAALAPSAALDAFARVPRSDRPGASPRRRSACEGSVQLAVERLALNEL